MYQFLIVLALIISGGASPLSKHRHLQKLKTPFKPVEQVNYRLPGNILPLHYDIQLKLEEDVFTTNTFSGVATITVNITQTVTSAQFHAKNIEIKSVEIKTQDFVLNSTFTEIDPITDIVTIQTETELKQHEEYLLTIFYTGILSTTEMNGFYKSSYTDDGTVHYVASTDFEPTNARKAFPSFDEPALKATFDMSITHPKNLNALFNTKSVSTEDVPETNLTKTTFETTPLMSTYLIAFVLSEYTCTEKGLVDGTPNEVCSRQQTANMRDTAVTTALEVLNLMKDYTGYDYSSFKIGKLTQTSIPDYEAGAMENWGLAIYRETLLLWDKEESSSRYQQDVVTVVAHELAHQWFGDLVTLDWWTYLFLNEGFATYFEYYAPEESHPDWQTSSQFVVEQLQAALESDSYDWAPPLSFYVESPEDINDRFDTISYSKGGSILRMVRYFLSLDHFKAGLTDYIANNQFSTATPTILWQSFEKYYQQLPASQKPSASFQEIMYNYTYKSGYPLLTVTSNGDDVTITQEQFLLSGSPATEYYVPVTYTLSGENFLNTTTRTWLVPSQTLTLSGALSNSSWIVVNNQQIGYYRVNYNEELWQKISQALTQPDFDGINVLNRAQIADDLFNLVQASKTNYSRVLDILSFLKNDKEYYPWYSSFIGFNYLLVRVGDAGVKASLKEYLSDLMAQLYESVPFDAENPEDHLYTLKQVLALDWACSLDNEDCLREARERFVDYRDNSAKPSRNLKDVIYCYGLRSSDDALSDFDFLWTKYVESQVATEQETILASLGCLIDEEALKLYLEKTVTPGGGIRKQDIYTVYRAIYAGSLQGLNAAFDFATTNYQQFVTYYGGSDELNWLIYGVANRFTNQEQLDKLESFIATPDLDEDIKWYASAALENAEENLQVTHELEEQLRDYFRPR